MLDVFAFSMLNGKSSTCRPMNHMKLLRLRGGIEVPSLGAIESESEVANVSVSVREPWANQVCTEAGTIKNAVYTYLGPDSTPFMKTAVLIVMMGN